MDNKRNITRLLQFCTFLVFVGRGWQHLFWDVPLRTLLWDESLLSGIVPVITGMTWTEYATSEGVDVFINYYKITLGVVYTCLGIFALLAHRVSLKPYRWLLIMGSTMLFGLAMLYSKEKFYQIGQLLEYSTQFGCPLFLYLILNESVSKKQLTLYMKFAIALTFTCHGLYAVGFYPQPGDFVGMVIRILGVTEPIAKTLLATFGWIDLGLAILLFVPNFAKYALTYATFWGVATAAARLWANFYPEFLFPILHQWTFEVLIRIPHGLLPFILIYPIREYFKLPFLSKKPTSEYLQSTRIQKSKEFSSSH
ncbi:hypothetical protein [Reichenbachiella ulvae]|uniref:Uncharacterized protein n=1 Tax=Reichenbachiella ulvae TaxID=2980104 RepID=A0ABT3CNK3_9BACT|nr:hypothetical protein [Reichenbachiella ulvae]MCV9385266.1 hypothetical protein [Reichenbachiella ulvae]